MPARVLLQDFTGVPAVVDLAAMRDGVVQAGRRSAAGQPAAAGRARHRSLRAGRSLLGTQRVRAERRAGILAQSRALHVPALGPDGVRQLQGRAARHRHRPPGQSRVPGARRVQRAGRNGEMLAYPDTLVGTDSHTTMVNGLGVVGWGVGGIEAEAAMLGQPISMLIPEVLGFRLINRLPEGATATDLVLTITERLRKVGVVGEVRRVLRARPRVPDDRRPRDAREHVARVRRDHRDLSDRRHDARLPAADGARRIARGAGRGVCEGAGPLPARRFAPIPSTRKRSRWICRPSNRASPGRSGRRTAWRSASRRSEFEQALELMLAERKPKPAAAKPQPGDACRGSGRVRARRESAAVAAAPTPCPAWKGCRTARSSSPRSRAAPIRRTRV